MKNLLIPLLTLLLIAASCYLAWKYLCGLHLRNFRRRLHTGDMCIVDGRVETVTGSNDCQVTFEHRSPHGKILKINASREKCFPFVPLDPTSDRLIIQRRKYERE
jgi:hypothetical protein